MKNKKQFSRPILALIGSILILSSIPIQECGYDNFGYTLLFFGSFAFGSIFQSIKQEQVEK